MPIYKTQVS